MQIVEKLTKLRGADRGEYVAELYKAPASAVVQALAMARDIETLRVLSDVVGRRRLRTATAQLLALTEHRSARVRAKAVEALEWIVPRGTARLRESVVERAFVLFRTDKDAATRREAAVLLGTVSFEEARSHLMDELASPDPAMRYCVIWALGRMLNPEAEDALRRHLRFTNDEYEAARVAAALAGQFT